MNRSEICSLIDHTLLKPEATESDIKRLAKEAMKFGFGACCVHQCWIKLLAQELNGTGVKVCSVVGFPYGTTVTKQEEATKCVALGADEIDMVINIGFIKSGLHKEVEEDIRNVVTAANHRVVKVILETALLTREEKILAAKLTVKAGAKFVKTSTGLVGGATLEDVRLLREVVGPNFGVKASGDIRTWEQVIGFIKAGASRIGTSAGVQIVKEAQILGLDK